MGVKGFTKLFAPTTSSIAFKDLKNQVLAVDASLELYRASLGMASVKGLTDSEGKSTLHISVILANLIKYQQNKIDTIWVFDFDSEKVQNDIHHNPLKLQELEERRKKKDAAKETIRKLKETQEKEDLFTDSDTDSDEDADDTADEEDSEEKSKPSKTPKKSKTTTADEIRKQEKIAFSLKSWMVNDIKLVLNLLDIRWVEAPRGVEGECLAARLTHEDVAEADGVLSSDADSLLFGAVSLIKKNVRTKKYDRYYLADVLESGDITRTQLIQLGIVLGTDMYKDKRKLFFRIGPKTVIAKIKSGALDDKFADPEVKTAIDHFQQPCEIDDLEWHNGDEDSFKNLDKINQLIEWLVNTKNFNRSRIKTQLAKVVKFPKVKG